MNDCPLSPIELRCVAVASAGMTQEETARALRISIWSVKQYRRSATQKLACKNTTHAVARCIREGWIP